jgi:peroxiredoxin (alkyl hydroperoxide reductase subunit C)
MQANALPDVGQPAPDFQLKGPGGQPYTLAEYRGNRNLLLVFFPLAFSPVCAHQLPQIQAELPRLRALDTETLGISVDSWYANQEFARKLNLSFPLLSDFDRAASAAYGVLIPRRGYSQRALFVVDKLGRVAWREVAPTPAEIPSTAGALAALEGLG